MSKVPDPYKMKRIKGPKLSKEALKNAKVRITTYLDQDVLHMLRQLASDSGSKYQAILNQILKDYFFGKQQGLVARLTRLEEAVFERKVS